jgi:hypothetical protein
LIVPGSDNNAQLVEDDGWLDVTLQANNQPIALRPRRPTQ